MGIRWRLRHVETKRNLADTPSRLFEAKHRIEQSCGDQNISEFVSSSLPVSVRLHEVLFLPETRREQGGPDNPEDVAPHGLWATETRPLLQGRLRTKTKLGYMYGFLLGSIGRAVFGKFLVGVESFLKPLSRLDGSSSTY